MCGHSLRLRVQSVYEKKGVKRIKTLSFCQRSFDVS